MSESIILVALALCIAVALLLARRPRRTVYDEPMKWQEPRDTIVGLQIVDCVAYETDKPSAFLTSSKEIADNQQPRDTKTYRVDVE